MADVILETTVPDAAVTRVLNAFTTITDCHMEISARGHGDPDNEFDGRWDFSIEPQAEGENSKAFGERVLRSLGLAVVKMVDKAEDTVRYRDAVAAVAPPESDVPDDVLT